MKSKRPALLYILVFFFLISAIICIFSVIEICKSWNWLEVIGTRVSPIYLLFKNSFLALGWLVSAILLWRRYAWAPLFGSIMTILTDLWYWADRLFSTQPREPFSEMILSLFISLILLLLILYSLYLLVPFMLIKTDQEDIPSETESGGRE